METEKYLGMTVGGKEEGRQRKLGGGSCRQWQKTRNGEREGGLLAGLDIVAL